MAERKPGILAAVKEHWPVVLIGLGALVVAYLTYRAIQNNNAANSTGASVPASGTSNPNFSSTDVSSLQDAFTNLQANVSGQLASMQTAYQNLQAGQQAATQQEQSDVASLSGALSAQSQQNQSALSGLSSGIQQEISNLQTYIASKLTPNPPAPSTPTHATATTAARASSSVSGGTAPSSGWRQYVIQQGDTLGDIGWRFGTTAQNLFNRNQQVITQTSAQHGNPVPGGPINNIFPGETIWVP